MQPAWSCRSMHVQYTPVWAIAVSFIFTIRNKFCGINKKIRFVEGGIYRTATLYSWLLTRLGYDLAVWSSCTEFHATVNHHIATSTVTDAAARHQMLVCYCTRRSRHCRHDASPQVEVFVGQRIQSLARQTALYNTSRCVNVISLSLIWPFSRNYRLSHNAHTQPHCRSPFCEILWYTCNKILNFSLPWANETVWQRFKFVHPENPKSGARIFNIRPIWSPIQVTQAYIQFFVQISKLS